MLNHLLEGTVKLHKGAPTSLRRELDWNAFGVRDPSILMNPDGTPALDESGHVTLFFNARNASCNAGGRTCVGVAQGLPSEGWTVDARPVFQDGEYAAQGSVLQLAPDHFRMYYSPDTLLGFALASSMDRKTWRKASDRLILRPDEFGVRRMGLPFVRKVHNDWTMLFEGTENGRFHIYQAVSADGITWRPANGGRPIYSPANDSWDAYGQANPSLYVETHPEGPRYFILYNGCATLHGWNVGLLWSEALDGPWHALPQPLLERGKDGAWDGGRLEGARLIDIAGRPPCITYFGLPGDDSYQGGEIAFAACHWTSSPAREATLANNRDATRSFNDKLSQRYFGIWDTYPIQRFTTRIESRLLDETIPRAARVVLLGCGGAREVPILLEKDCKVTAVDISPGMLAAGAARYPDAGILWVEADLHALPEYLTGFDAAVSLGAVFNYLQDAVRFLEHTRRCLRPGATLILDLINADHPSERSKRSASQDGRVRQLYDLPTLTHMLESAGFELVSIRGVRFFADLLPNTWNRANAPAEQATLMEKMLELEDLLTQELPAEQAKFLLVHAKTGV